MNLAEARNKIPGLNGLSDDDALDVIHQGYYPNIPREELGRRLGVKPPEKPVEQAGVMRTAGDVGIKLAQGVVDLGAGVVGLGSLATGGMVGKGMRAIGYDPQKTNEILGEYLSDSQKASDAKVAAADGFVDTIATAVQNPRAIVGSIAQSAPGMVAGMGVQAAVARGIATKAALATGEGAAASAAQLAAGKSAGEAAKAALGTTAGKKAASAALDSAAPRLMALGAGTEGAQSAGQIADDAQAAGRAYGDYALPALAAGVGTAAIGLGAGKLMGDAATQIATGSRAAGVKGGLAARAGKEFFSEGVLEEMPQSAQEQIWTNVAMGEEDRLKGVGNAAGTGLVTGGVMGVGMGALQHNRAAPVQLPNTGPLSQAANAGQAAIAAKANAMAPQAAGPSLDQIDARMAELVAIGHGQLASKITDGEGNNVAVPAVAGRPLSAEEQAEYSALKSARAAKVAIPADQQAEFDAALAEESSDRNAKHAAAMAAAAQARSEAEDQQIRQLLEQDEAARNAAAEEALRKDIAAADDRVTRGDLARAEANRAALREQVRTDGSIPDDQKTAAFRRALADDGYLNNDLTADDHAFFTAAAAEEAAAAAPLPSTPNELVDAVPERQAAPAAPAAVNTRAVDDAIASGMRLKTANGKVLHKPGSAKIFTLSSAQKAYYHEAIARLDDKPAAPAAVTEEPHAPAVPVVNPTPASNDLFQQARAHDEEAQNPSSLDLQQEQMAQDGIVLPMAPDGDRTTPVQGDAFDDAAHQAATSPNNDLAEPTDAQKEAGNYKLGHARLHGLDLSIENPAGSVRRGEDRDGTAWENTMQHHYGYLRGTRGADKGHIDAFIGPQRDSTEVFVVNQVHPDNRKFDEHKVMLGFDSIDAARAAYQGNYAPGWTGGDTIVQTTMDGFKDWLASGNTAQRFPSGSRFGGSHAEHIRPSATPAEEVTAAAIAPPAEAPAAEVQSALAVAEAAPAPLTKQQLNRKTVKDMSDAELLEARNVLAGTPRAPKIDKEIAARKLDAAPAAVTEATAETAPAAVQAADDGAMLANATAPEHIQAGVDDRELGQIVAEFNDAQQEMMQGEHAISNIFQPPAKGEIVRLNDKAKIYHKDHGWMTPDEAKVKIAEWKAHALAQGADPASRSANSQRVVLSLFDLSGEWSRPWEEAGYQVYRFDIQDDPQVGDVNNFSSEFFSDWFSDFEGMDIYAILAATPCTDFASSGARHFAAKDKDGRTIASVKLVHQTLRTIEYFKPSVWALENPVGRIESLGSLPPWRLSFDPNHLGDPYTKKTLLWGRFNGDLPVAPVEPTEGSKMHRLYGGKSMATKNARSVTPEGFSYGFFMANNAIDHAAMAIANKFDRLDRSLITEAVNAGITEQQINEAVEDHYYMDQDDDAANMAIRALIEDGKAPDPAPDAPPPGKKPTKAQAKAELAQAPLRQDYGVAHIDGYTATDEFPIDSTGDYPQGGVKGAFLADAKRYLTSVATTLKQRGYADVASESGKTLKSVSINEGGPAVSGDASLVLYNEQAGQGIYVTVGGDGMGIGGTSASGVTMLMRVTEKGRPYGGGANQWLAPDMRVADLADAIDKALGQGRTADPLDHGDSAPQASDMQEDIDTEVIGKDAAAPVEKPADMADTDKQLTGQNDDSTTSTDTPALDIDLVARQRPAGSESVARGAKRARAAVGRADDGGLREPGGHPEGSDDVQQDLGNGRGDQAVSDRSHDAVAGSDGRVPARDFQPVAGGLTREGSWYDTARRNVELIELAQRIEQEGRPATPQEQEQLSKYVGFGAADIRNRLFPVAPDYAKRQQPDRLLWPEHVAEARWRELAERMEALPREWQKSVLQSSQYAHYTSEGIIRSIWSAAQRMGFTGGKVFEPGMGIGSFAMLMPQDVRDSSRYTGVEFDGPTATIAKLLSPEQNMLHDDFIKRKFPADFFDLAIGNPPFSQTKVFADPDYEKNGFMLHDFFFAKSIDRVRPGGLLAFVTSKGTMDKQNDKARKYLTERADLVGAIRLPSTAFESNAGTSVVTDVIFLRKRLPGEQPGGQPWANVQTVDTKDGPVVVNEYFAANPAMVLGQQRISGNTDDNGRRINANGRGGEQYTVVSYDATPAELDQKFAAAIESLPENVYSVLAQSAASVRRETAKIDFDPSVKRDGVVYVADDGTVMRVESGVGRPLAESAKLTAADAAWFKGYVGLRDLVQEARLAQSTDGKWETSLKKLNKAYDQFRKEHGPINDFRLQVRKSTDEDGKPVETTSRVFKNRRRYREDYDSAVVTQLETINEAGDIVKAPFLLGRTIGVPVSRDVKSIGDALAVSLDGVGQLDLDDVARRIGLSRDEAIDALGDQVFQTPAGEWQLADEYLSGDVVAKLEEAEQAARLDPRLRRNVDALAAAQPEKLGPSQISAKLGSAWIPAEHVNAFAKEIEAGDVSFDPKTETWQVEGGNLRTGRRAGAEYGTAKRSPSELLEAVLNSRPLKVTTVTEDRKTVVDVEATVAANEAAKKIKDKFRSWVWTDGDRATELVESYNKRFNNIAPRRFDGSHLTLPGVSMRYNLYPHQKNVIWRQVQVGDTYLAHAVGAGKTIEMIVGGMEQKRLGLINKPMYVVPNHMLEQFANEFMELYPLANIMVADDENFSAERRKAFVASATLNNPDAVIITHDAFQRIGVKEESVAPIRDEILADLEIELSETAKNNDTRVRRSQLEQQIEAVTQRFDRIIAAGGKDSTIKFEDIGVDFVYADEAHVYRKLDFHTSQQIKGIDPNGSKRALDMYVKTRYLQQQRPGRAMTFASGTPITNTMGELYTIMRFFAPNELDRAGIATFDSWSRMFGEVAPALEPNAAGKYELVERFAKFDNVPELMSRVRQFMDVLTSEHLGALVKRPDLAGGKPHLNIVEPSDQLQTYMASELGPRIERSKRWKPTKEQPNNPDPIVAIITDGRFAALDPRFFGGQLEEGEDSILTVMADKVVKNYHATSDNVYLDKSGKPEAIKGSTQMVFYNLGFGEQSQINRGFNSRNAFTKLLVDGGVKRAEIAWFDDANTDAKKEQVFKGMRSGQIRVLIGSAKKMGTGVNAQKRLIKLHYQDPPWFPSDVEQPHGRIIRQGNQNGEVGIDWYTTKGTYQSTMWQMVARKQRFIDQAFTGDKTLRSMDDLGEASLFEQAAAVASGDPRAVQLAGLKQEVERLERLQSAHASEQIAVRNAISNAEWSVTSAKRGIATYGPAFKQLGEQHFAFNEGDVQGVTYDKPGEFGQALKDAFNDVAARSEGAKKPLIDVAVAKLAHGITLTMDTQVDAKGKKTGEMDLTINIGDLALAFTSAPSLGAQIDAAGFARRVFNAVNGVEADLRKARDSQKTAETDLVRLHKKRGAPFAYQQELGEKYAELKRLEEELRLEGVAASAAAAKQIAEEDAAKAALASTPASEAAPAGAGDAQSADYFRRDDEAFGPESVAPVGDDAGTARPDELSTREMVEALKDAEQLNRQLRKAGMAPVRALRAAPSAHHALARQIGKALGIKVQFVSSNGEFEGVASKGVAYLADGMRSPTLAIAGHEVLHALEQSNPALGQQLRAQIGAYLKNGVVSHRQAQEHVASGFQDVSIHTAEGEVLADINGAMWLDPQFWSDLAKADRSLFRTVAYKFMELAAKAINAMRGSRFDVTQLVTDVAAVRAIMVEVWAQHAQQAGGSAAVPGAAFSRDAGDTSASLARAKDAGRQFAEAELQYGGRDAYDALKAAGATQLSYMQWVITKTPNFKQFYGDWEATNGATITGDRSVHSGMPQGDDAGGLHGGADAAAGGAPAFPGQSGPVRAGGGTAANAAREPVIYYHGSRSEVDAFDLNHPDRKDNGWLGTGVYGTSVDWAADLYASGKRGAAGPNIMPLFMAVKNPYVADLQLKNRLKIASRQKVDEFTADLAARGYDGVVLNFPDGSQELVAFNPAAVKSAIGNNGAFDAGTSDLRFSRSESSASFDQWFAGSKVVNEQGNPLTVYHGTSENFSQFKPSAGWYGDGIYFTPDASIADEFAQEDDSNPGRVVAVQLRMTNPYLFAEDPKAAVASNVQLMQNLGFSKAKIDRAVSKNTAPALITAALRKQGYDGLIARSPDGDEYMALNSDQIKFVENPTEPKDSGLLFSRTGLVESLASAANAINDVRLPAGYMVGDLFNQSGKISWWHKTIGTMENLARRQGAFRPVYEDVQAFLGDVSRFGVVAADKAPTLLPKLEDVADIIGKNRKKPLSAADTKAIGAPIFEGTLTWARDFHGNAVKVAELEAQAEQMTTGQKAQVLIAKGVIDDAQHQAWQNSPLDFYDNVINSKFEKTQLTAGVVWTDAELRDLFGLNDHQIALYREFRAALDKSLTNLTVSEMVKLGGKDAKGMLEQAVAAPDLPAAALLLRDHFIALAGMEPERADMHLDTAKQIMDLGDKGIDLMARGYAPLSRFGKYTVYVQQGEEQVYFGMFETQYEASRMARQMRAEHPDAEVTHGTVSEDAYKLFAGVSPETIELFGSMIGLDSQADAASSEVYQAYLKLAKNNRSAMKRMIQRKGIAGFSEDAGRVLAGFIYSNARLTAGNAHLGEVDEAINAIPKVQGELKDAAMQLRESIRNPAGGNRLGGLMFAQFLGGSVASAMVNLTQPMTMTLPFLSQYGGLAAAGRQLIAAVRDAAKGSTGEDHLDKALQWAADEGIVAPQEIHYLQAQAAGKGALRSGDGTRAGNASAALNNTMSKVQLGWGKLFAMAELANRRITFIAAYRTAIEQGIADPAKFAEQAVSQTQGTYNSGNKPRWARNAIGGLLMTFKQYSIGYLELLTRMATAGEKGSKERAAGQRAALYMIAVLFLMAGADGLPFEQDIEDAIDGALQRLGYNFSTKRAKQAFLTDVLGEGGAAFALKGISSMPGMPIDVAGRFGMGNLIPATGLLKKKESYTQDLGELAGPAGDVAKRAFTASGKLLGGDLAGAALDISPAAVRNAIKGTDMLATGAYKDGRGYKVNDVSAGEGVLKIIGFQPNSTAHIQDAKGQALDMISQNRMRSAEIQEHWAQGIVSGDADMVQEARAMRDDWNAKNPDTPIRVNLAAIYKRVRNMRMDVINRTQKTAPKAIKAAVRGELAEVR